MELRHLRYLVALAESLNFTRAAERVHVTQSTLSHQIRKLEDEIGYVLFDRATNHVALTDAGEVFLAFAVKALHEVDLGLGALKKDSSTMGGELRIGATNTFNLGFIPKCVATFLSRHPGVKVSVDELSADGIRAKLNQGELDIGIAYRPAEPSDLVFEPLHNEEMVLAVSSQHPFAARKRVRGRARSPAARAPATRIRDPRDARRVLSRGGRRAYRLRRDEHDRADARARRADPDRCDRRGQRGACADGPVRRAAREPDADAHPRHPVEARGEAHRADALVLGDRAQARGQASGNESANAKALDQRNRSCAMPAALKR